MIGWRRAADMIAGGARRLAPSTAMLDAPLRFGYTGGTTGKSKAVVLTTRGELTEMPPSCPI